MIKILKENLKCDSHHFLGLTRVGWAMSALEGTLIGIALGAAKDGDGYVAILFAVAAIIVTYQDGHKGWSD